MFSGFLLSFNVNGGGFLKFLPIKLLGKSASKTISLGKAKSTCWIIQSILADAILIPVKG